MDKQQLMAFIQSLPPEQQQQAMAQAQQMMSQEQPPQMPPQQQDPRMGMPGQNQSLTPQQKIDSGNPDAFRDYQGEGAIISDQQAQAEALRGEKTPRGIYTSDGGFIAANPLQHIASAGKQIMGNYQAKEALQAKKDLSTMITTTQQQIAEKARISNAEAARKKEMMEQEMRNNRRGGTVMEIMAGNQNKPGYT